MKILVSACLLGECCKYSGGHNACAALLEAAKTQAFVPVCPEVLGGLPTPRPPAERQGERVVTETGADVTDAYQKGARLTLETARRAGCTAAILKKNSPSCGYGTIYDGQFTHTVIPGDGVTAELLADHGIAVYNEETCGELLNHPKSLQNVY